MSTSAPPAASAPAPARSGSAKYYYLLAFNALSALAWLVVLFRVVLAVKIIGFDGVHGEVDVFWRMTQSVAALEVAHAVFGTSRPPSPPHRAAGRRANRGKQESCARPC